MQQQFSHDFMLINAGCYVDYNDSSRLMICSFMKNNIITLYSILHSEIPLRDKYWFVCTRLATKEQNQQIAIHVAEIVLPIYEKRYPENKAPREAIDAAKAYIAGHIFLIDLIAKRRAAAAAAYAAAAAADAIIKKQLFDYLLTFLEVPEEILDKSIV